MIYLEDAAERIGQLKDELSKLDETEPVPVIAQPLYEKALAYLELARLEMQFADYMRARDMAAR